MKKLIATLITGLFAAGAFANTPAPAAEGAAPAMAEKTAPKKSHRAKKSHHDKKAEANAMTPASAQH